MTKEIRLLVVSLISLLSLLGVSLGQTGSAPQSNAATQQRKVYFGAEDSGRLETVILRGSESIQRHELGSLTPPNTARFFAVTAADSLSHQIVKGIEVQLEGDDPRDENGHCKSTIYLDEESLTEFQRGLERSIKSEEYDDKHTSSGIKHTSSGGSNAVNPGVNRDPSENRYFIALNVNYYWHGDGCGVEFLWHKAHRSDQLRLPNANIRDVLEIVRVGRAWLAQNPAHAPVD